MAPRTRISGRLIRTGKQGRTAKARWKRVIVWGLACCCPRAVTTCTMPGLSSLPQDAVTRLCPPSAGPTGCADGSDFSFLVRPGSGANARKVLVDFMGGGACWDEACLSAESIAFQRVPPYVSLVPAGTSTAAAQQLLTQAGYSVAALGNSVPELSTYTYVFVPYCTQDIHLGSCTVDYSDPQTGHTRRVRHNGAQNTRAVMDWVYASFPAASSPPETLAFIGCSAGASAVIATEAARASRHYHTGVRIIAVGDSPTNTLTEHFVHEGLKRWGIGAILSELSSTPGLQFSPSPMRASLLTDAVASVLVRWPATRLGYYSSLDDANARSYWIRMRGVAPNATAADATASWRRHMLASMEILSRQPNFRSFLAPGAGHCRMTFDAALTNPTFSSWLVDMLGAGGLPTAGSGCTSECTLSDVVGCDGLNGSRLLEDRCMVCNGTGSTCPRLNGTFCSCKSLSATCDDATTNLAPEPEPEPLTCSPQALFPPLPSSGNVSNAAPNCSAAAFTAKLAAKNGVAALTYQFRLAFLSVCDMGEYLSTWTQQNSSAANVCAWTAPPCTMHSVYGWRVVQGELCVYRHPSL
jgi:hypothetical protein